MKALIHEERLGELIKSSLSLMCKTSLRYTTEVEIKGLLGITLDKTSVFLVDVKELIRSEEYSDGDYDNEEDDNDDDYIPGYENTTQSPKLWSQKRSKQLKPKESKRRKRTPEKITKQEQNDQSLNSEHDNFNQDILDENGDGAAGGADMLQDMADNTVEQPRFGDSDAEREMTGYSAVKVEKPDTGVFDDDNADFCDDADDNYDEDNESGSKLGDDIVQDPTKSSASEINTSGTTESMEDIKTMAAFEAIAKATKHDMEQNSSLSFPKIQGSENQNVEVESVSFMDDSKQKLELTKRKKHKCPHCEYTTIYQSNMIRHKRQHDQHYKVTCLKCSERFASHTELKTHMRALHTQLFFCQSCAKSFRSRTGLIQHKRSFHDGVRNFKCDICSQEFYSKTHYFSHMRNHTHPRGKQTFKCPTENCNKVFKFESFYNNHIKNCSGSTKQQCDECKMELSSPQALKDHVKGAHEGNLFICACGKSYKWRGSYYNHRKYCKYASLS